MKVNEVFVVCLFLCYIRADDGNLDNGHRVVKRQAQDIQSPSSSPRGNFVSPDGEPYYKYQPPVSSNREALPGRRAASPGEVPRWREATTRVRIAGAAGSGQTASSGTSGARRNGAASKPNLDGSRGRTYKYPFGKERVQYTGSQPQGYTNETQEEGINTGGTGVADSPQDILTQHQHQQQQQQQQQLQQQHQQQQRYNPVYGRPTQRSPSNSQNNSSQDAPNQDESATVLQEQELRRRHDEVRRRHEVERRRQEEDRRKLIEERRKQHEERRRLYYEQQRQRANQQSGNGQNGTGSHQPGLQGSQQESTTPATNIPARAAGSDQSGGQHVQRTGSNSQQGQPPQASSNQQETPSSSQQRGQQPTRQQPTYDDSQHGGSQPQQPVYSGSQQGGYLSQPGQSANSGSRQAGSEPQQQPYSGSQQAGSEPQQQPYSGSRQAGSEPQQQPYSGSQQSGYVPQQQQPTSSGSRQSGYVPPFQQSSDSGSQQAGSQPQQPTISGSQRGGYSPQPQQPVYIPTQRQTSDQQPISRSNYSQSKNSQGSPQQQNGPQVQYQQPGQVDPRTQPRPDYYPGQGQGHINPHPGTGANLGSSFSYEQQDTDLVCPDTGIDLRINGLDCHQAVTQFGTYLCYTHEYTSRDCCQVCRPRRQMARTGCEYGDHAELCSSITPADCYDLRNRYSCCETCERLKRHHLPAGCEYGDMTGRCDNVRQNPGLCYVPDNQRLCCETCNQIRNLTNTGCPWGDYHSNLCQLFDENTSNVRINCYSKQRQKLCCQSCERLRDWVPADLPAGCQYGDRPVIFTTSEFGRLNCSTLFSYFSTEECRTNDAVATNCCHTCHRLLNHRG